MRTDQLWHCALECRRQDTWTSRWQQRCSSEAIEVSPAGQTPHSVKLGCSLWSQPHPVLRLLGLWPAFPPGAATRLQLRVSTTRARAGPVSDEAAAPPLSFAIHHQSNTRTRTRAHRGPRLAHKLLSQELRKPAACLTAASRGSQGGLFDRCLGRGCAGPGRAWRSRGFSLLLAT